MSRLVIVVRKTRTGSTIIRQRRVGAGHLAAARRDDGAPVINCRSYKYLGTGYYVAAGRGARAVIPSVRTINDCAGVRCTDSYGAPAGRSCRQRALFDFGILVISATKPALEDLARRLRGFPILRIEFERDRVWQISAIKPTGLHSLSDEQEDAFAQTLDRFSRKLWRKPRARRKYRFDLAMLVDPNEAMPPSNKKALKHFIEAGSELGIEVDPIGRNDYQRLAEYDGLFIRETTALDNHTYRFANRAEKEDMVVVDDPESILKCTNKIYMHDLMLSRKLPIPRTEILYKDDAKNLDESAERLGFPLVLKIPDGSFSRGIVKVESADKLKAAADALFQHTALVLAQEFMFTEFDWRIGVFNREPLYACKYYMSRGHWQIYNHAAKGTTKSGGFETLPIREAPADVVKLALKATAAIGDGLYGVDIKKDGARLAMIEVNDNPSIDAGVEDAYLGADLYRRIMAEFLRRMERKRLGTRG
jgi:glutathione synthase/RimK-type ligase-like ATP-grasp enzyme